MSLGQFETAVNLTILFFILATLPICVRSWIWRRKYRRGWYELKVCHDIGVTVAHRRDLQLRPPRIEGKVHRAMLSAFFRGFNAEQKKIQGERT